MHHIGSVGGFGRRVAGSTETSPNACTLQEEQDAARYTNLKQEAERCRSLLLKEQASHISTRCALQAAQRRLRGRHLDSHHAPPHTPESTLRPYSAPLSRPPNIFQYSPAMHAHTEHPGTARWMPHQVPHAAAGIRSDHRTSTNRRSSTARGSPGALVPSPGGPAGSTQSRQTNGYLESPSGVYGAWASTGSSATCEKASRGHFYNRHACTVVEDLVSTSAATIRSHKAQLRAASARPYMRTA